jgi:hypothetical protein
MLHAVSPEPRARALRAALVRYDTVERSRWRSGFDTLAAIGFDAVDLPIVWSAHQPGSGPPTFEGALSVRDAIRSARDAGLGVRVRLGPRCVETDPGFGVPRWVLADPRCAARSARRGAILEFIGLTPTPAPSLVSQAFQQASVSWITAAIAEISDEMSAIDAIVLGPGTFAPTRADAVEFDCHPDARPLSSTPDARALDAERRMADYLRALLEGATRVGVPHAKLRLSLAGTARGALGLSLADRWPLDLGSPLSTAGTDAIWDTTRTALALAAHGASIDVSCGTSPFSRPIRNRDAAAAARVVLAAGASSVSVRGAWVGRGWIGSMLDEQGEARPAAQRWRALFEDTASIPPSAIPAVPTPVTTSPSALPPVSRGWLSQHGLFDEPGPTLTTEVHGLRCAPENAVHLRPEGGALVVLSRSARDALLSEDAPRWLADGPLVVRAGESVTLVDRGARSS